MYQSLEWLPGKSKHGKYKNPQKPIAKLFGIKEISQPLAPTLQHFFHKKKFCDAFLLLFYNNLSSPYRRGRGCLMRRLLDLDIGSLACCLEPGHTRWRPRKGIRIWSRYGMLDRHSDTPENPNVTAFFPLRTLRNASCQIADSGQTLGSK